MRLEIMQTRAQIGIDRVPSKMEIQTNNAKLELHQKHAKINITTELPKVEIDQYEAFASAGLKNFSDLAVEAARRGYQQAIEFIEKTASDGDMLAAIERGGNPIADIAERDAFPEHEFTMGTIPSARPKITVKGSLKIEAEPNGAGIHNGVEISYTPGNVNMNYTPAKVNIFMKQYASVNIKPIEGKLNAYI